MLVMNSPIVDQIQTDDSGKRRVVFESVEDLLEYSRNLLGEDKETFYAGLAEAEGELQAEEDEGYL